MSPEGKPTKPIIAYTRVSNQGKRSDEEMLTHELQRGQIEHYCKAKNIPLSPTLFEDTDRSGGKLTRPAFDRAIAGVLDGTYGGIAVAYLDRFARTREADLLIAKIEEAGGTFIALDFDFDTSTAMGRAMLAVVLAFATLTREQAVEKAEHLARVKLAEGTSLGGVAPLGYKYEVIGQDTNGKDILGWLVPSADAPVVLEAFQAFAQGSTLGQIADLLNAAGALTSRGNVWNTTSVRDFLRREVYAGVRTRGEVRIPNAHERIVGPALWRKVQKKLAPKPGAYRPAGKGEGHVLGEGLIRCGLCGGAMVRGTANGKYGTLRCMARGGGHPAISYPKAEKFVVESVIERIGYRQAEVTIGRKDSPADRAGAEARLAQARADLAEAEEMIGVALPAGSRQVLAVEEAEDALAALGRTDTEGSLIPWYSSPDVLRVAFASFDVPTKRRFLRECVERVVLTKEKGSAADRLRIEWVQGFEQGPTEPPKPPTKAQTRKILKGLGVPVEHIL